VIVTDNLKSYGAAKRERLPRAEHRHLQYLHHERRIRINRPVTGSSGGNSSIPWLGAAFPLGQGSHRAALAPASASLFRASIPSRAGKTMPAQAGDLGPSAGRLKGGKGETSQPSLWWLQRIDSLMLRLETYPQHGGTRPNNSRLPKGSRPLVNAAARLPAKSFTLYSPSPNASSPAAIRVNK
jgi:hypothetical protein